MKLLLVISLLFTLAIGAQQPMKQDSLPVPGKPQPVRVGTPPVPPLAPTQVDTFYPAQPDSHRRMDSLQRDDRQEKRKPGMFRDTIPK